MKKQKSQQTHEKKFPASLIITKIKTKWVAMLRSLKQKIYNSEIMAIEDVQECNGHSCHSPETRMALKMCMPIDNSLTRNLYR